MSYSIGEEGGSLQACIVILPGGPSLQNAGLTLDISVAATGDTATGEYTYIMAKLLATQGTMYDVSYTIVGEDFTLSSSSVTLSSTTPPEGECVTINIATDLMIEGDETLTISITSQTTTAVVDSERASAVLTIEDDEGQTESRSKTTLTKLMECNKICTYNNIKK